jgi:glycosyltransferase involved in cell wall biosynthesis
MKLKADLPSLSVVIPCFNVESFVERAVNSVLEQNYPLLDIILVDNNSTDGTSLVLKELTKKSKNIVLLNELTPGACAARNKGWRYSKADYIHFLDADDFLLPKSLEIKMDVLKKENCDFLINGHIKLDELGSKVDHPPAMDPWKGLFTGKIGGSSSNILSKLILERIGGWNEGLSSSQETNLYFEVLKLSPKISIVGKSLSVVVSRPGQISKGDPSSRWTNYIILRERIIHYLVEKEQEYYESNKQYYLQYYFDIIHILYRYNPRFAVAHYNRYIQNPYLPKKSHVTSKGFIVLLRIFGYEFAERIKSLLKK